jgi:hypothetical protein
MTLDAILEWLDDRIASSEDAGSRLIFSHIRRRLAVLELRERQLRHLREAIRPIEVEPAPGERTATWVIDADAAARVLREIDEER